MPASVELEWDSAGPPSGDAVVFGHSLGADRSLWEPQVDALRASHRTLAVDFRGHGASPVPSGPYSIEEISLDVIRVADAARVDRFHYCGVSLGGIVGLWLAAHCPDRIRTLIAANTASKIGTTERWAERCRAVDALGMENVGASLVPAWFSPGFPGRDPTRFDRVRRVFAETDPRGYKACCWALGTADVTSELGSIRAPTLVVGARLDASTPVVDSERLHTGIPRSSLVVLDEAAHLSNLDQSEAFTGHLRRFLSEHGD